MKKLIDDDRPIKYLEFNDSCESLFAITGPYKNCEKIVAYNELGIGSETPWIAVYRDGEILCRVPSYKVTITY